MRIVGLFGAVLTILTAGLLLETSAGAQPPAKLTDHITDSSGVLTDSSRATVRSAIDRLYRDRHVQLWVVSVDNFSKFKPDNCADRARSESGMGDNDALLAMATNIKLYAFTVPPKAQGLEQPTNRPDHYGRALQRRRADALTYFDHHTYNGPTEAINGRLEAPRGDPYCTAASG
jgi:TPM domain